MAFERERESGRDTTMYLMPRIAQRLSVSHMGQDQTDFNCYIGSVCLTSRIYIFLPLPMPQTCS